MSMEAAAHSPCHGVVLHMTQERRGHSISTRIVSQNKSLNNYIRHHFVIIRSIDSHRPYDIASPAKLANNFKPSQMAVNMIFRMIVSLQYEMFLDLHSLTPPTSDGHTALRRSQPRNPRCAMCSSRPIMGTRQIPQMMASTTTILHEPLEAPRIR
jgi:hypothetical protein